MSLARAWNREGNVRRTKIVATVGPASNAPEMLVKLIQEGVDVFRLNYSHGSRDEHARVAGAIREAALAATDFSWLAPGDRVLLKVVCTRRTPTRRRRARSG